MRLKSFFHSLLALLSGSALGFLGWSAYWNINVIPSAAWPVIVSSPLMQAIHGVSPALDIPFAIAVKALPLSVLLGLIGGCLLPRLRFPRVFCYSVFLWPLAYFIFGYYTIRLLDSAHWPGTQVLWRSWHDHRVIAFAVYGWFFVGLYVGEIIAKRRITSQSTGLATSGAPHHSQPSGDL